MIEMIKELIDVFLLDKMIIVGFIAKYKLICLTKVNKI